MPWLHFVTFHNMYIIHLVSFLFFSYMLGRFSFGFVWFGLGFVRGMLLFLQCSSIFPRSLSHTSMYVLPLNFDSWMHPDEVHQELRFV